MVSKEKKKNDMINNLTNKWIHLSIQSFSNSIFTPTNRRIERLSFTMDELFLCDVRVKKSNLEMYWIY